jgi:predicted nucleic acid-binding protein
VTGRRAARRTPRRSRERAARYAGSPPGPVVVDASVAVLWFVNEPDRWGARRLLDEERPLLAPDLMAVEVVNALWKKLRRREMELADVEQAVTGVLGLGILWTSSPTLLRPAVRLAAEIGHPVYDCLYLALAASSSALLATADDRLRRRAEHLGVRVWSRAGA